MKAFALTLLLSLLTNNLYGAQNQTWDIRRHWIEIPHPTTTPAINEPDLDQAEQLLVQQDHHDARKILIKWRNLTKSPRQGSIVFSIGRSLFQRDAGSMPSFITMN